MQWIMRIVAWRSNQTGIVRWLEVFAWYALALATRIVLGRFYGGIPSLAFFPVLIIVAVRFGWKEALAVLGLSVTAGLYLFLPGGLYLVPAGWLIVGGFTIAVISGLKTLAQQLAEANERQRLLFRELQHRVANTLQSVVGVLETARRRIDPAPEEAKNILERGVRRILASVDVHRRMNDPALFEKGLSAILRDLVAAIFDTQSTYVLIDIQEVSLTFDQMYIITLLVSEFANNAQKHVFARELGCNFEVSLQAMPENRAVLCVKDDGPGWSQSNAGDTGATLGQAIVQGLADQLDGTVSVRTDGGTEVNVVFPTSPHGQSWPGTATERVAVKAATP